MAPWTTGTYNLVAVDSGGLSATASFVVTASQTASATSTAATSTIKSAATTTAKTTATSTVQSSAQSSPVQQAAPVATFGGGGGGESTGGGGGSHGPTIIQSDSCYDFSNLTKYNTAGIIMNGIEFNLDVNFITPSNAGISINSAPYTFAPEVAQEIKTTNKSNYTAELTNISYIPIEDTVRLSICESSNAMTARPNSTGGFPTPTTSNILPTISASAIVNISGRTIVNTSNTIATNLNDLAIYVKNQSTPISQTYQVNILGSMDVIGRIVTPLDLGNLALMVIVFASLMALGYHKSSEKMDWS